MTLRALRERAGLTQDELAQRTGISQAAISALENGRVPNPGISTLEALCAALDCDLSAAIASVRQSISEAA